MNILRHEHLFFTPVASAGKLILGEQPSTTADQHGVGARANRPRSVLARDNGYFTHIDLEVTAVENADVTETRTQIGA